MKPTLTYVIVSIVFPNDFHWLLVLIRGWAATLSSTSRVLTVSMSLGT